MSRNKTKRCHIPRRLRGYNGPYPYQMLNDARFTLMRSIDMKDTQVWYQIRQKTGIFETGERAMDFKGWGDHSTYFSHADLFEENGLEGECFPSPQFTQPTASTPSATITTADLRRESTDKTDSITEVINIDADDSVIEILDNTDNRSPSKRKLEDGEVEENEASTSKNVGSNELNDSVMEISAAPSKSGVKVHVEIGESSKNVISKTDDENKSSGKVKKMRKVTKSLDDSVIMEYDTAEEGEVISDNEESGVVVEITDQSDDSSDVVIVGEDSGIHDSVIVIDEDPATPAKGKYDNLEPQKLSSWKPIKNQLASVSNENQDVKLVNSDTHKPEKEAPNTFEKQNNGNELLNLKPDITEDSRSKPESEVPVVEKLEQGQGLKNEQNVGETISEEIQVYKCDFCDEICQDSKGMNDHLTDSCHFSASTVKYDTRNESYRLVEKLAIMKKENMLKQTVAICPKYSCNRIFSTVYDCSLHHSLKHDNDGELISGVAEVLKKESIINPCFTKVCPVCKQCNGPGQKVDVVNEINALYDRRIYRKGVKSFSTWLKNHYAQVHAPFDRSLGECNFMCAECHESFQELDRAMFHQDCSHLLKGGRLTHDMEIIVIQTGKVRTVSVPEQIKTDKKSRLKLDNTASPRTSLSSDATNNDSTASTATTGNDDFFVIDRKPILSGKHLAETVQLTYAAGHEKSTASGSQSYDLAESGIADDSGDESMGSQSESDEDMSQVLKSIDGSALGSNHNPPANHMFGCDYCDFVDKDRSSMFKHLHAEIHSSASIVEVDANLKPVVLFRPMAIQNYRAAFNKVAAACPMEKSSLVFPNIYQCNVHIAVHHKSNENIYGIANITKVDDVEVSTKLVCNVCGFVADGRQILRKHVTATGHYPPGCNEPNILFFCPYCENRNFTYFEGVTHVIKEHPFRIVNDVFKLRRVHVDKKVQIKQMIPFSADDAGAIRNFQMNQSALSGLKQWFGQSMMYRQEIKQIQAQKRLMRQKGKALLPSEKSKDINKKRKKRKKVYKMLGEEKLKALENIVQKNRK